MAFTVQLDSKTPTANANAYVDVAFFDAYHADRGNVIAAPTTQTQKEQAIVRATSYVDMRFRFVGCRTEKTQTLEFPREDAYDDRGDSLEGLPLALRQAVSEYALRALTANLIADPTRDATGRVVTEKSESVGPLKETTKYAAEGSAYDLPDYPAADRLLYMRGLVTRPRRGLVIGNVARG